MKKTLLHITEVSSGGVLPVVAGISNGLSDKYNVVVAYGIRFDTPKNIETFFNEKVQLIVVKNFTRELSLKKDLAAVKELRKIIKEMRPDIIHMHSSKAGLVGRIGLIFYNGQKYYTPHGYSFLNQEESLLKRKIYYWAEKIFAHTGCVTIACGCHEFKQAKKLSRKVRIVNNGIDTKCIDNILRSSYEKKHKYTVYTAGRIGVQKNPKLFNEIAQMCPDINFVWIGGGSDEKTLTSNNICVTGFVDRKQVIQVARNCDCYISCSLWEGLPIALLEAMYLEKPCVVSDVIGNNDLIIDGETGWIAHNRDEFIMYIQKLSKKSEKNSKARKLVKKEFTVEKMCEQYEKIYR